MELGISLSGFLGSSLLSQEPQFIAGRVFIVFHSHWISVLQSLKRREALGPEAVLASCVWGGGGSQPHPTLTPEQGPRDFETNHQNVQSKLRTGRPAS